MMVGQIVTVRGVEYRVTEHYRVTGTGPRFDGRMRFSFERVSDGARFAWLGSRHTRNVPANAALSPRS